MEGQNRRVVVSDGIGLPNALTYDSSSGQVCWADAGERARFHLEKPAGAAIKPPSCRKTLNFFLLCASGTKRLECVFPDGSGRRVVHPTLNYPFSMVYHSNHFYYTDWRR